MMPDDQNKVQEPGAAATAAAGAPKGGFGQSIIDIFVDPLKVFARIDAGLTWWKPFVLVCVVAMILAYFTLPLQRRVIELNARGLSEEQLQKALEGFGKFGPIGIIMVPIISIIGTLILAGIVHLIINIMSTHSNYKKTLSLVSYCGVITIVEQIIGTVVLRMRGAESIESAADMKFSLSLAPLAGGGEGFLGALLQSLSIFWIWYYVLLILGIAAIFRISRKQAIIAVLPVWILYVLMLLLGNRFSGGMG